MSILDNTNVLMVTIDSCTYETALRSKTPFLNSIGKLRKCETLATYTYPAHHAFFIGNLPLLIDGDKSYFNDIEQIWRSTGARESIKPVGMYVDSATVLEEYRKKEYSIIGAGGVTFFNSLNNNNILPKLFDEFYYFDHTIKLPKRERIPRPATVFPLEHQPEILSSIGNERFFLFINTHETHIPYDHPGSKRTENEKI
jgi:hypothetical protein